MKVSSLPKIKNKLTKKLLYNLYIKERKSTHNISILFKCSENKINYWLKKYDIKKRSLSDAMYLFKNPLGDPFFVKKPHNLKEGILFGLGLGLYWGEGEKRGKGGIRITNTDINMIRKYIEFLEKFFNIDKNRLRFSIQIFKDISPKVAIDYWSKGLGMDKKQFYRPLLVNIRGQGTYKYKSKYGVVIVYFNNIKLKKIICNMIENIT